MTANNRIFYACQAVGIKPCFTSDNVTPVHGAQSVGINTSFNLEQAFELGMIQIYENIEGLPDVEITTEKVIDGYPLIYHLSSPNAVSTNITGRSKERCCISLGIYGDDKDVVSGIAPVEVYASGMYQSNISYSIPVDGNCTESISFVGNDKRWFTSDAPNPVGFNGGTLGDGETVEDEYRIDYGSGAGEDEPLALDDGNGNFAGGIQRRENVRIDLCIMPQSIYGVDQNSNSGNAYEGVYPNGSPRVHFQSCNISTDTSREDILELGRKNPYYRSPNFPIEVTCELEAIAVSGDFVDGYSDGRPEYIGTKNEGNNSKSETILIKLQDGTCFDLGSKNRLASVSYGGGDATGGNATLSYSYTNFNDLKVLHPKDPASGIYSSEEIAHVTR